MKLLIYYITITIALSAIGFETFVLVTLFTTFFVAFLGAAALALAIGAGVAIGLGAQDYVERNIGDWMSTAREKAKSKSDGSSGSSSGGSSSGGGGPGPGSSGGDDASMDD